MRGKTGRPYPREQGAFKIPMTWWKADAMLAITPPRSWNRMFRGCIFACLFVLLLSSCGDDGDGSSGDDTTSWDLEPPGEDPDLDELWYDCDEGAVDACEALFRESALGSDYYDHALARLAEESTASAETIKRFERILREQLQIGSIAYTAPEEMRVGRPATVTARISREELAVVSDELTSGLTSSGRDRVETAVLEVGTRMRATLQGDGFAIRPLGAEEKSMRAAGYEAWTWQVTAERAGSLSLYLTVYAMYEGAELHEKVLEREIAVEVDRVEAFKRFVASNWQWFLAFLFGNGAIYAVGRAVKGRLDRRNRGPIDSDTPRASSDREEVGAP
jgi:hypothetical protein